VCFDGHTLEHLVIKDHRKYGERVRQRGEGPIKVAATPAEPIASQIDSSRGNEHEVNLGECARPEMLSQRLVDTVCTPHGAVAARPDPVEQPIRSRRRQHHIDASRRGPLKKAASVGLRAGRQKTRQGSRLTGKREIAEPLSKTGAGSDPAILASSNTGGAHGSPYLAFDGCR